jgi:hypothetical protein
MKRLLALIVFLSGCSGGDFTSGLFNGVDSPDAGEAHTDSAPFLAGGAPGSGGASGSGGVVAATGGAPELDAGHGTGGSSQTGGAPNYGGSPGTGGVVSTGGTVGTGGAVVDAGCALVAHDNGVGQTWQDCIPLGTYGSEQATKACKASGAPRCVLSTFCGAQGSEICGQDAAGAHTYAGCWGYDGDVAGRFTDTPAVCPVDDASSTGTWN